MIRTFLRLLRVWFILLFCLDVYVCYNQFVQNKPIHAYLALALAAIQLFGFLITHRSIQNWDE